MWEPPWHSAGYGEATAGDGVGREGRGQGAMSEPRCLQQH